MEAPAPAPDKVKITRELIAQWSHDAAVLLDANCGGAAIIRDLRQRGCTPRMAEQIVANAKGPVRNRHRLYGLLSMSIGAAMLLLGDWIVHFKGIGHHRGSIGLVLSEDALIVGGVMVALLGVYKFFTGSAVDVRNTVLGTADDELNEARQHVERREVDSTVRN